MNLPSRNSNSNSNSRPSSLLALTLTAALAACRAPVVPEATSTDALSHTLAPQSLQHGMARAATPSTFLFAGKAGDDVQPDVWPTAGTANALVPTLQLFGPADSSGARPLLAEGTPGDEAGDVSLELTLPQSGTYQLRVGAESGHEGRFSLRFWTSGSAAPRPESMQVSLALRASDAVEAALSAHAMGNPQGAFAWSGDEIDAIAALIHADGDPSVAISDLAVLYSTLETAHRQGLASDALVEKVEALGAGFVGTPAQFAALPSSAQTLALYWLGVAQPAVFKSAVQDANISASAAGSSPAGTSPAGSLRLIAERIAALVASWSGAIEETSARQVLALSRGGVIYGYQASWQADLLDSDAKTQVFTWASSDYFGAQGNWLGESSQGALEPDDG